MTDSLSVLSDSGQAVVHTLTTRLNPKEALNYLKESGFDICERTYYRYKNKVEQKKFGRLRSSQDYHNLF